MNLPADIAAYQDGLAPEDRELCDRLAEIITEALPEARAKVWHRAPVWFLDGNPIVGYDRLKSGVRLLFWSGRAFPTPGLKPEGTFEAAEQRFRSFDDLDEDALRAWLAESREYQWDYEHIRTNRGLVKRTEF